MSIMKGEYCFAEIIIEQKESFCTIMWRSTSLLKLLCPLLKKPCATLSKSIQNVCHDYSFLFLEHPVVIHYN